MVSGRTYPTTFIVPQQCSQDVILGIDLTEHRAIIDLESKSITFSMYKAIPPETRLECHVTLSVLKEVSVAPRSSVIVPADAGNPKNIEGIMEGNTEMLLN